MRAIVRPGGNGPRFIPTFKPNSGAPLAPLATDLLIPEGLLDCSACTARSEALRVVPGQGPRSAQIVFIGQNPGAEEDQHGRPFIGPSGIEFDRWLVALGLDRTKVYVTNLVKCTTHQNRPLRVPEIQTCSGRWLVEELTALTAAQVLVPLGKPAVERLLGKAAPPMLPLMIHHYRMRVLGREMRVFPLPHPAFLLRAPHHGPTFRDVLLPQVRETLQQDLPMVYDACRSHQTHGR